MSRNIKPPSNTPSIRVVMMPGDANPQGTIFGGVITSLIDQAAFVEALRQANHKWVTVAMDSIEFHAPVYIGDVLSLWATTTKVGTTSLRAHVEVRAYRPALAVECNVTEANVVMVAVDDHGKKVPVFP